MARRTTLGLATSFASIVLAASCVHVGGTQERRLIDLNDGPPSIALPIAQEFATQQELDRLRARAKARFPGLAPADLEGLQLGWQEAVLGDGKHVMLEITFVPASDGVNAKAVADYVALEVRDAVLPRLKAAVASQLNSGARRRP